MNSALKNFFLEYPELEQLEFCKDLKDEQKILNLKNFQDFLKNFRAALPKTQDINFRVANLQNTVERFFILRDTIKELEKNNWTDTEDRTKGHRWAKYIKPFYKY